MFYHGESVVVSGWGPSLCPSLYAFVSLLVSLEPQNFFPDQCPQTRCYPLLLLPPPLEILCCHCGYLNKKFSDVNYLHSKVLTALRDVRVQILI